MIRKIAEKVKPIVRVAYENMLKAIFIVCELLMPKKNNYWCFCTWGNYPHTLDNPRAVFEYVKNDREICKIVLVRTRDRLICKDEKNVIFVNAESFAGAYFTARSKVILLGYSLRGFSSYGPLISNSHNIIQLWHGIPLKRIGLLFPEEKWWNKETVKYTATICSSSQDKQMMKQAFSPIPENNVWQCGLPRNDFILMDEEYLPTDYYDWLKKLKIRFSGRKVVLYVPTWREHAENIYEFNNREIADLTGMLERNDAILAIRGHSNVRTHGLINMEFINDRIINVNDVPDVNLLLRLTDVLVTDYSSIFIDFLVTDKPVLHFTYDLEDYYKERGFLYDINEAFACKEILLFDNLVKMIEFSLKDGILDVDRYNKSKQLFHDYRGHGTSTVVENIKNISLCK